MLKILVIFAAIAGSVSCVSLIAPQGSVNTTVGGNVTLLCLYKTEMAASDLIIQWNFYSAKDKNHYQQPPCSYTDEKSIGHCRKTVYVIDARGWCSWRHKVYFWQRGVSYTYGQFKGRVQAANSTGNASITLFNAQPLDTGVYTCDVLNPPDTNSQSEKSVSVNILVPPSKPLCSFYQNQDIRIGHLVTLVCLSEIGLPHPTYHWYKVSGDTVTPVTEPYDPKTGFLAVGNLTKFEEGYYHCTASNYLGNSTCHIDLTIKHSEGGIIVGALIAAILAAALICVIVWILTKKEKEKKKKRKEKAAVSEMQTMAQKEPLNAEYVNVPTQENTPLAAVPTSNPSNETNEIVTPPEIEVSTMPENEMQSRGPED